MFRNYNELIRDINKMGGLDGRQLDPASIKDKQDLLVVLLAESAKRKGVSAAERARQLNLGSI